MSLMSSLLPPLASSSYINTAPKLKTTHTPNLVLGQRVLPNLLSLALAVTLASPLPSHAIPSLNSQPPPISLTTPFSQSKNLELGLENGYVNCRHSSWLAPLASNLEFTFTRIHVLSLRIMLILGAYSDFI